jgi:hypothetical protein
LAVAWPENSGAVSQTNTSKSFDLFSSSSESKSDSPSIFPVCAVFKKLKTKSEEEYVRTISFLLMCSFAYLLISKNTPSISSSMSSIPWRTCCLKSFNFWAYFSSFFIYLVDFFLSKEGEAIVVVFIFVKAKEILLEGVFDDYLGFWIVDLLIDIPVSAIAKSNFLASPSIKSESSLVAFLRSP